MRTSPLVLLAALAACAAPSTGFRGGPEPAATRYINPGTMAALPGFTHAVKVGQTVYISRARSRWTAWGTS